MAKRTGRSRAVVAPEPDEFDDLPAVRFIPVDYDPKDQRWYGNKPALCFSDGRCVINTDEGIQTVERPPDIIQQANGCVWNGAPNKPYPLNRFVAFIYDLGKPISAEARMLLRKVGKTLKGWKEPEAPEPSTEKRKSAGSGGKGDVTGGADLVRRLADEFGMDPPKLRRTLRKAGLQAPYTDEEKIRKALQ